ncbi:universal stress protein [Streptomyces sp. NPDC050658]|uniref:universal stress protein n=1 Tax=unclassified Streptomyces TaxID=2593676 RepID=UPI00344AAB91
MSAPRPTEPATAPTPIVVGVDADARHRGALAWGADEARRRDLPLRLVVARVESARRGLSAPMRLRGGGRTRALPDSAEQTLREAIAFVRNRHPHLEISTLLTPDAPVPVLCAQTRTAAAVVLGPLSSGSREARFTAADVALPVIARAHCPVVVVPDPDHSVRRRPFFVVGADIGWDGRRHSAAAVHHAFEAAARHGAALRVLYVWRPPLLGVLDERAALRECRRILAETVAGLQVAHPTVAAHHAVVRGHTAQVLTRESAHTLGLVVGTPGHGRRTGRLFRSVLDRALRRARCPVVAVPRSVPYHRPQRRPGVSRLSRLPRRAVRRCIRPLTRLVLAGGLLTGGSWPAG